jgi:HAD superfamily hydrolase (TIGR01509 family)
MSELGRMSAVFFDMDGTLIDSETLTEPTVVALCNELGVHDIDIDCTQFFGGPWLDVERTLVRTYPQIDGQIDISARLQALFADLLRDEQPPLIPGSRETVIALSKLMPVAIVTSSGRESAAETIRRMGIADNISFYAGFEDYENGKPEPDGYLKAARTLQVDPKKCLVFEDSIVGIQAAKNAGMTVIAVTHRCSDIETATQLADRVIQDYSDLGPDFFDAISAT